jgi:hypothetical protein
VRTERALGERFTPLTVGLFLVNAGLQVFDGIATYLGCLGGVAEGNPLVAYAMETLGIGTGVLVAKLVACACLATLWLVRQHRLVPAALTLTATAYIAFSAIPWTAALLLPLYS